ncbi:MAG: tRNA (N6-threonylcarbamoyladenosine(37)-N6)-methyltransferase TrmO [Clostridia bacterium]|nr:tRNA (N6-threonylcarbamoyladenosine(37)-N6)-methyltransferase TrmO [Clostridia bacterium]
MKTDMSVIARVHTDFPTKFGIPRQSGLVDKLPGYIVFEKEYRNPDALAGIEGFSHLWLIFGFSACPEEKTFRPRVRPPRLGGNAKMGVFATRSPFRPNPIGLSSVRLCGVENDAVFGPVLRIAGADLVDGTPLFDIKPYLPFTDCHPDAKGGFGEEKAGTRPVEICCGEQKLSLLPKEKRDILLSVLAEDPHAAYQSDPERVYGFPVAGCEVRFRAGDGKVYLTDILPL